MTKVRIDNNIFGFPMPVVLVGAVVDSNPNFMTAAWVTRVNFKPPMLAVALGSHYTNKGIEEHKTFSVNIPDVSLLEKTDYCGMVSGSTAEKSKIFDFFYGQVPHAPLITECPLSVACKVIETVRLPADTIYVADIVEVFIEERCLTDGIPDILKINPFTLTMPDNNYWAVGAKVGKAWQSGKSLM